MGEVKLSNCDYGERERGDRRVKLERERERELSLFCTYELMPQPQAADSNLIRSCNLVLQGTAQHTHSRLGGN